MPDGAGPRVDNAKVWRSCQDSRPVGAKRSLAISIVPHLHRWEVPAGQGVAENTTPAKNGTKQINRLQTVLGRILRPFWSQVGWLPHTNTSDSRHPSPGEIPLPPGNNKPHAIDQGIWPMTWSSFVLGAHALRPDHTPPAGLSPFDGPPHRAGSDFGVVTISTDHG